MSRSRNLLHKSKLADFRAFCQSHGWSVVEKKDVFEVLRMRHPDQAHPLIVHDRLDSVEHYTTWGNSETMARQFVASRKQPQAVAP